MTNWMARIEEAQPFGNALLLNPGYVLAVGLPPLLALAIALWRSFRGPIATREKWIVYAAFLILAVLVMLWQVRAARMAMCLSIPAGAALIVVARDAYVRRGSAASILGLVLSWLGFAGLAIALGFNVASAALPAGKAKSSVATEEQADSNCRLPADFSELATLPAQRVMAPIDLGAHILAFTPHSVVGAPYHRAAKGIRDTFDFFNGPIQAARALLEARGITLVVACPGMAEMRGLADSAPDSFVKLHIAGALPDWLEKLSPPNAALEIYQVR
jgi:hypothetical protein